MIPTLLASSRLVLLLLLVVYQQSGCSPSPPVPTMDCTAVQCLPLETACIEEGAPSGDRGTLQHSSPDTASCCPVCLKKGCRCRGYQLWDCISAGYTEGTVPAGGSYLVDSGSTECSCPARVGGEIECRFLPCPELPPNCLEVWDPLEEPQSVQGGVGCPQCKKTGCVIDGRELEEGESFAVPPCKVCSCLGSGALQCTPEKDCEGWKDGAGATKGSGGPQPALLGAPTQPKKKLKHLTQLSQRGAPRSPQGAKHAEKQERAETMASRGGAQILGALRSEAEKGPWVTQVRASRVSWPLRTDQGATQFDRQERVESTESLGQNVRLGATHTRNGITQPGATHRVIWPLKIDQRATQTEEQEQEASNRIGDSGVSNTGATRRGHFRSSTRATEQHSGNRVVSVTVEGPRSVTVGATFKVQHGESQSGATPSERKEAGSGASQGPQTGATHRRRRPQIMGIVGRIGVTSKPEEKPGATHVSGDTGLQQRSFPAAPGSTQVPQTSGQGATLRRGSKEGPHTVQQTGNQTVMSQSSLDPCCAEGHRLAAENRKCTEAPSTGKETDTCRVTRMFCCLTATEEGVCQAGVTAARQGGGVCQGQPMGSCADDTARLCCECCALGMRALSLSLPCSLSPSAPPLPLSCTHSFITCCEGEGLSRREPRGPQGAHRSTGLLNPCSQFCTDTGQSLLCSCFPGYQLNSDLKSCKDIDECITGQHSCSRLQRCINSPGSFRCSLESEVCPQGYAPNHRGRCSDTNECDTDPAPCTPGFNCVNTIGSFTCHRHIISCGRGYHASEDGTRCTDVDECVTGVHRCADSQICTNAPGTYRCQCARGYQAEQNSRRCEDIDECAQNSGRVCAQNCHNTPGSYHCRCEGGYSLAADNRNCQDVNECESSPCSQECANVFGSYHCYCQKGFVLNQKDKTTCEDIDECSLHGSPSLCSYRCVNSPGSFHCACPELGYELASNGRNCRDQDECALGTHNCTSPESCFNIEGGFRCLSVQCPPGYLRTEEHVCERESCSHSSFSSQLQCQSLPQRVSFHQLSFPSSLRTPVPIFRIAPSPPVFSGDRVEIRIVGGNEEGFFSARSSDRYSGLVSVLASPPSVPRDFLLLVEMTLQRHGAPTRFQAQLRVFVTPPPL
ncbi:fibulin-2-like isoform X2 [Acipenser ruthenus]|uniref:fibulin-2-like isoform X2 n=1 Tax=Acipenser ruthenus TaxID=7906 RepID=UPI00145A8AD7|nr:fibulin-2-like isoform X2 [Acipenser ruthenus]